MTESFDFTSGKPGWHRNVCLSLNAHVYFQVHKKVTKKNFWVWTICMKLFKLRAQCPCPALEETFRSGVIRDLNQKSNIFRMIKDLKPLTIKVYSTKIKLFLQKRVSWIWNSHCLKYQLVFTEIWPSKTFLRGITSSKIEPTSQKNSVKHRNMHAVLSVYQRV